LYEISLEYLESLAAKSAHICCYYYPGQDMLILRLNKQTHTHRQPITITRL